MDKLTQGIRSRLVKLASLQATAARAGDKIRMAAEHRLGAVESELDEMKPRVMLDDGAAKRYEDLVIERGRLNKMREVEA